VSNAAEFNGGAIYSDDGAFAGLKNCVVTGNTFAGLKNCVVTGNTAKQSGSMLTVRVTTAALEAS
jgi:predicted outer membrane repeat protein